MSHKTDKGAEMCQFDEILEQTGKDLIVEEIHNLLKPAGWVETDNVLNHFFVVSTATEWVVWHIMDIPLKEVNDSNVGHLLNTRDGMYIWPQAAHFWTEEQALDYLDTSVEWTEKIEETSEVIFL